MQELAPLSRGYTREPEVAAQIAAAPPGLAEFRRRLQIADFRNADALRAETLVYALRALASSDRGKDAWQVADCLIQRAARTVQRRLAAWRILPGPERDDVMDEIAGKLYTEWFSLEPSHEFWEVRFGVCLERAISDEIAKRARRYAAETTFSPVMDSTGDETDPWDAIPDETPMDAEISALVNDALEQLQEPLRTAFRMYYYLGATEEDIARHLQCTSRTVRNYLSRSRDRLRRWREE